MNNIGGKKYALNGPSFNMSTQHFCGVGIKLFEVITFSAINTGKTC